MADTALEESSLFQLNVLIWATFPQPDRAPVNPILLDLGYRLFSIEQPLEPSILTREALSARNTSTVSEAPVADALLEAAEVSHFVIVECKSSSFGVESEKARQARGLILAGGGITQRSLPIAEGDAEVCYVVPKHDAAAMAATLVELREGMRSENLQVCGVGVVGLSIRGDGVYLGAEHGTQAGGRLPSDLRSPQRVLQTRDEEDPRPLYVIPWIPESPDEDLSALREKLRSQLLSHIGRSRLGEITIRFDELLNEVSRGVYGLWRDRQSLRGQVNRTVGSIVRALAGDAQSVILRPAEMVVGIGSEEERQALMERIRLADVPVSVSEGLQLTFDEGLSDTNDH